MNQQIALAKICNAYLNQKNISTWDLRCFEFWNKNDCYTKVESLLMSVDYNTLSPEDKSAYDLLKSSGIVSLKHDLDFTKELIKR